MVGRRGVISSAVSSDPEVVQEVDVLVLFIACKQKNDTYDKKTDDFISINFFFHVKRKRITHVEGLHDGG